MPNKVLQQEFGRIETNPIIPKLSCHETTQINSSIISPPECPIEKLDQEKDDDIVIDNFEVVTRNKAPLIAPMANNIIDRNLVNICDNFPVIKSSSSATISQEVINRSKRLLIRKTTSECLNIAKLADNRPVSSGIRDLGGNWISQLHRQDRRAASEEPPNRSKYSFKKVTGTLRNINRAFRKGLSQSSNSNLDPNSGRSSLSINQNQNHDETNDDNHPSSSLVQNHRLEGSKSMIELICHGPRLPIFLMPKLKDAPKPIICTIYSVNETILCECVIYGPEVGQKLLDELKKNYPAITETCFYGFKLIETNVKYDDTYSPWIEITKIIIKQVTERGKQLRKMLLEHKFNESKWPEFYEDSRLDFLLRFKYYPPNIDYLNNDEFLRDYLFEQLLRDLRLVRLRSGFSNSTKILALLLEYKYGSYRADLMGEISKINIIPGQQAYLRDAVKIWKNKPICYERSNSRIIKNKFIEACMYLETYGCDLYYVTHQSTSKICDKLSLGFNYRGIISISSSRRTVALDISWSWITKIESEGKKLIVIYEKDDKEESYAGFKCDSIHEARMIALQIMEHRTFFTPKRVPVIRYTGSSSTDSDRSFPGEQISSKRPTVDKPFKGFERPSISRVASINDMDSRSVLTENRSIGEDHKSNDNRFAKDAHINQVNTDQSNQNHIETLENCTSYTNNVGPMVTSDSELITSFRGDTEGPSSWNNSTIRRNSSIFSNIRSDRPESSIGFSEYQDSFESPSEISAMHYIKDKLEFLERYIRDNKSKIDQVYDIVMETPDRRQEHQTRPLLVTAVQFCFMFITGFFIGRCIDLFTGFFI